MNIVVTGSIAYDYLMRFPGRFAEHFIPEELHQVSLSFLVDDMSKHWGGVAANIAFSLARLGQRPRLMGTVGRDFPDYRVWLEGAGVNTDTVRQLDDVYTASFFCNTDLDNNQIASFYAGAMGYAEQYSLQDAGVTDADLVLVSPNQPEAMSNLAAECRERGLRFLYDPSQQVARLDGPTLKRDMQGAYAMVINAYELSIIMDKTGLSLDDIRAAVQLVVVTHSQDGSRMYTNGDIIDVPAFPPDEIKDPTGAGDAYRAGLVAGLAYELPLKLAGEVGALTATYALENIGPQSHQFTPADFVARFRARWDDGGALDAMLRAPANP